MAVLAAPATARAANGARRQIGAMIWGSAYVQFVYRAPITDSFRLEMGGAALPLPGILAGNASLGLALDLLTTGPWTPLVAVGPGAAFGCGEGRADDGMGRSKVGLTCTGIVYGHARAGAALFMGEDRKYRVSLEGGAWYGIIDGDNDGRSARTFLWPAIGIGFYVAL